MFISSCVVLETRRSVLIPVSVTICHGHTVYLICLTKGWILQKMKHGTFSSSDDDNGPKFPPEERE